MKFRGFLRVSVVSLAALALLGLAACSPKKPAYVCDAGVTAASEPQNATPPTPDPPLATQAAGEEARAAVTEAEVLTPDGRVPLVTVEQTPAGPEVTSTPVANQAEAEAVAEAAAAGGDLVVVEPDSVVTAAGDPFPDDPHFGAQYTFDLIDFVGTWVSHGGPSGAGAGSGQKVAVLDTGVNDDHADLGVVEEGPSYRPPAEGPSTQDNFGHGTKVAGIIAAATDNATGIAGAAPAASILSVKVLDNSGRGLASDVAKGIEWAANQNAVINLSLGGPTPSDAVLFMVRYAVFSKGVPVISSSGNSGKCGAPAFPAAFPEVLAVGSSDQANQSASFSTTGPYVDLVAPGVGITSTLNDGTYGDSTGTSFSAPYVAAAAAIVRATHPGFDANQVIFRLVTTATDLGPPGWDPHFGFGIVNMPAAAA